MVTAILRNQEAKRVRDIGSLIFETPIQHDYETGVEVRSLLPTEQLEEMDGRLAVTDEDPHNPGVRYVKFWVDEAPRSPEGSRSQADEELTSPIASARDGSRELTTPERRQRMSLEHEVSDRNRSHGSPVSYQEMMPIIGDTSPRVTEMMPVIGDTSARAVEQPQDHRIHPGSHQKIKFLEVALYIQWNR